MVDNALCDLPDAGPPTAALLRHEGGFIAVTESVDVSGSAVTETRNQKQKV